MRILIIGPAHPLRGGIANFSERLAQAFRQEKDQVEVLSFSLQYPGFLFPGKTQYTDKTPPELTIYTRINSINPLNWIRNGLWVRKQNYDMIIVMYWQPFMAPCLGTIAKIAGKKAFRVGQLHNMIPHEPGKLDKLFSRYFVRSMDAFMALSKSVLEDLKLFDTRKPRDLNPHPIYDSFGDITDKYEARRKLNLNPDKPVILFFGFIRKYKGLDLLLKAVADQNIKSKDIQVVVAGEFYDDQAEYLDIIRENNLDNVVMRNNFIADEEVALYFSASDLVVQPYRSATQSGVTQIAFHFEKPMVVTDVGGLSEIVPHKKAGYVVKPEPSAIAEAINEFYDHQLEKQMIENVKHEKLKYSWDKLIHKIKALYPAE
ncbi:MAG: glycosyltransferase [Bacteroidales bacterium]